MKYLNLDHLARPFWSHKIKVSYIYIIQFLNNIKIFNWKNVIGNGGQEKIILK